MGTITRYATTLRPYYARLSLVLLYYDIIYDLIRRHMHNYNVVLLHYVKLLHRYAIYYSQTKNTIYGTTPTTRRLKALTKAQGG